MGVQPYQQGVVIHADLQLQNSLVSFCLANEFASADALLGECRVVEAGPALRRAPPRAPEYSALKMADNTRLIHEGVIDAAGVALLSEHHALPNLRKITLAQVHETVDSAGLMLKWACDLIVAAEGAPFADVVGTRLTSTSLIDIKCTQLIASSRKRGTGMTT